MKYLDELVNLDQLVKLEDYETINFYLTGDGEDSPDDEPEEVSQEPEEEY